MIVQCEGRVLPYPSLDGEGLAGDPHQERPVVAWADLTRLYGLNVTLALQEQASSAELAHVQNGLCTIARDIEATLVDALNRAMDAVDEAGP